MFQDDVKEFVEICKGYKGALTIENDKATFKANNLLTRYYCTGEIHSQKVSECVIEIWQFQDTINGGMRTSMMSHDKTWEMVGGHMCDYSKEQLLKELDKYNFKRIGSQQMSMFDFI